MTDDAPQAEPAETENPDPWADDRLNRKERAEAFTNLVTSDTKAKVISIEAGFGEGKTFFREAWAKHLRLQGETVIEFDAWKTDHSSDPLVSFVGALMGALPSRATKTKVKKASNAVGKIASVGAKAVLKAALKEGAEDLIESFGDSGIGELADKETVSGIKEVAKSAGNAMSKAASAAIMAQLAAERTRTEELPKQLENLRAALQTDKDTGRVIVIIDELDRCRPDYAISLLESIKHLFDQPGYIFVLMLNADQLERTASNMFGKIDRGEPYFSKFIDMRLTLSSQTEDTSEFVQSLLADLPYTPWNDHESFNRARMNKVAATFALPALLSMRQIKSAILNVEIALMCRIGVPTDGPLLVACAFRRAVGFGPKGPYSQTYGDDNIFPYLRRMSGLDGFISYCDSQQARVFKPVEISESVRRIGILNGFSPVWNIEKADKEAVLELEAIRERHLDIHNRALIGAAELRADE